MKPNARQLAMRDPAMLAQMGVIGGVGMNFGHESRRSRQATFGQDYGFGSDYAFGADDQMMAVMTAPSAAAVPAPTKQQALGAWAAMHQQAQHTSTRERLIEPNKGSLAKIQKYWMGMTQSVVLGTATALSLSQNPTTNFRPSRFTCNAPAPGFASLTALQISNVNSAIGGGIDAFDFNANAVDQELDLPTISPAIRVSVTGTTTTFVPPGYVNGASYLFSASLKGYATMVA